MTFGLSGREQADLAIVGGGPAGATAALYAARADLDVMVIDRGITAGALGKTDMVANFPGLPAMPGAEIVATLRRQAERFGARFAHGQAIGLSQDGGGFVLGTSFGDVAARAVIAATGSMGRSPSVPGEADYLGHGVSYCATCDGPFFRDRAVAVAGRTDEAAEEAMYLAHLSSLVHLVIPGDIPEDAAWQALLEQPNVRAHARHSVKAITGAGGGPRAVRVRGPEGEAEIDVEGVFLYLQGQRPITDWMSGVVPVSPQGCVSVGPDHQTAVPGLFAVGDVLCTDVKQAVIAAAQGSIAAMHAERLVHGRRAVRADWR